MSRAATRIVAQDATAIPGGAMNSHLLRIYLQDHLAAAVGGGELSRRTLKSNRGTTFEPALEKLAKEIEEDRLTLIELMRRVGVSANIFKQGAVWAVEKVARLKLNGRVLQYSPLSRLIELEALGSGIDGKRALWAALRHVADAGTPLDPAELQNLEKRAADQRKRVETMRLQAARLALATGRKTAAEYERRGVPDRSGDQ